MHVDAVDVITPSLTALFNLSLQTRSFPSIWKTAKVIPFFETQFGFRLTV